MPVSTDEKGRRSLEMQFDVPGTPEQVWQAIATGPGFGAWFVPAEVEERAGGAVKFHLGGGMVSEGQVTVWQPPERFAIVEPDWSESAPPLATEFTIHALGGGSCRIRLVHSIPSSAADWDEEIGSMEKGWPAFFAVLRLYLGHFAGQPACSAGPMARFDGSVAQAWEDLCGRLGLADAQPGGHRVAPNGAPPLAGRIEQVDRTEEMASLLMLLDSPMPGTAIVGACGWAGKVNVSLSLFFYGEGCQATAAAQTVVWDAWMAETYPSGA